VDALRADQVARVTTQILSQCLPSSAAHPWAPPAALAALDHLVHGCCWRTAQQLAAALLAGGGSALLSNADVALMQTRLRLRALMEEGNCGEVRAGKGC